MHIFTRGSYKYFDFLFYFEREPFPYISYWFLYTDLVIGQFLKLTKCDNFQLILFGFLYIITCLKKHFFPIITPLVLFIFAFSLDLEKY